VGVAEKCGKQVNIFTKEANNIQLLLFGNILGFG
jgi:hypothetical protein